MLRLIAHGLVFWLVVTALTTAVIAVVVTVPCNTQTTYAAAGSIVNNSMFVITDCASPTGTTTMLTLATTPPPANLSIVAQNSVNVVLVVDGGVSAAVYDGLVITIRNVTNPMRTTTGCATNTICMALLTLSNAAVRNLIVSIVGVSHHVSPTSAMLVLVNLTALGTSVSIANCTTTSYVMVAQTVHYASSNMTIAYTIANATSPSSSIAPQDRLPCLHMYWADSEIGGGSVVLLVQSRLLASVALGVHVASVGFEHCTVASASLLQFIGVTWDMLSKSSLSRCELVRVFQSTLSDHANVQLSAVELQRGANSMHVILFIGQSVVQGSVWISLADVKWTTTLIPSALLFTGYALLLQNSTIWDESVVYVSGVSATGTAVAVMNVHLSTLRDVWIFVRHSSVYSPSGLGGLMLFNTTDTMHNVTMDVDSVVVLAIGGIGFNNARNCTIALSIRASSITAAQPLLLSGVTTAMPIEGGGVSPSIMVQLDALNVTILSTNDSAVAIVNSVMSNAAVVINRCLFLTPTTTEAAYVLSVRNSTLQGSNVLMFVPVLMHGVALLLLGFNAHVSQESLINAIGIQYLGINGAAATGTAMVSIGEQAHVTAAFMSIQASLVVAGVSGGRLLFVARSATLWNATVKLNGATTSAGQRGPAISIDGARLLGRTSLMFVDIVGDSSDNSSVPVVYIEGVVDDDVAVVFSNCQFTSYASINATTPVGFGSTLAVYQILQAANTSTSMSIDIHNSVIRWAGGDSGYSSRTTEVFVGNNSVGALLLRFTASTIGSSTRANVCNVRLCNNTGASTLVVANASRFVAMTHSFDMEVSGGAHVLSMVDTTLVVLDGGYDDDGSLILFRQTNDNGWRLVLDRITLIGRNLQVARVARANSGPSILGNSSIDIACCWWGRHEWSPVSLMSVTQLKAVSAVANVTYNAVSPSDARVTCPAVALAKPSSASASPSTSVSASRTTLSALTHEPTTSTSSTGLSTDSGSSSPTTPSSWSTSNSAVSCTRSSAASISSSVPSSAASISSSVSSSATSISSSVPSSATSISSSVPSSATSISSSSAASNSLTVPSLVTSISSTVPSMPTQSASIVVMGELLAAPPPADPAPLATAAIAAGASAMFGGGAIGDAVALASLSMLTCAGQRDWDSNAGVQRLVVSVFYDLGPTLSVVGNAAMVALGFVVHWGAVVFTDVRRAGACDAVPAASLLRFPSFSHGFYCFLFPGLMFGVAHAAAKTVDATSVSVSVLGAVAGVSAMVIAIRHAHNTVWPTVTTVSMRDLFERHLPPRLLRWSGWVLPPVMWLPRDARLQQSTFFASARGARWLPLQPLFQYHGALFSFVAALPLADVEGGCAAQYGILMLWTTVPLFVVIWVGRMQMFRRPLNDSLGVATQLLTLEVLASTAVYFEGPRSMRDGALQARVIGGWLLMCVSVVKAIATCFALLIERYVVGLEANAAVHRNDEYTASASPKAEVCEAVAFDGFVLGHGLSARSVRSINHDEGATGSRGVHARLDEVHRQLPVRTKLRIAMMDQEICGLVVAALQRGDELHPMQRVPTSIQPPDVLALLIRRIAASSDCFVCSRNDHEVRR